MLKSKNGIKKHVIAFVSVTFCVLSIIAFWQGLVVREYTLTSEIITSDVKVALITDLHSTFYGENQEKLIKKINEYYPDLILLAGDIADDKVPHDGTEALLSVIGKKYPCFYVTGNHEFWTNEVDYVKKMILSYNVTVLSGEACEVSVGEQTVVIAGVDDPAGLYSESEAYLPKEEAPQMWKAQLESVCEQNKGEYYSILLSHRPEQTEIYSRSGFDLVVSGHAHGGQVRVPFLINGIVAPNQGFFPKYAGGCYNLGETDMVVSRGLCVDEKTRVFNPPELVFINIEPK